MNRKKIHNPYLTKQQIKNAFFNLLIEKSYDQISVSELSKAANINRVTFYSHYDNVATLMEEIETDFANTIISTMNGLFKTKNFHEITTNCFLDAFLSTPEVSIWFSNNKTTGKGASIIYEYAKKICITEWKKYKRVSTEELSRFFDFYYYGSMAYLKKWFTGEFNASDEELRKDFIQITGHSVRYIFGHDV